MNIASVTVVWYFGQDLHECPPFNSLKCLNCKEILTTSYRRPFLQSAHQDQHHHQYNDNVKNDRYFRAYAATNMTTAGSTRPQLSTPSPPPQKRLQPTTTYDAAAPLGSDDNSHSYLERCRQQHDNMTTIASPAVVIMSRMVMSVYQ